jgi:hypothetical protein
VDWLLPWNGGSEILFYKVEFQSVTGAWIEYKAICDGTDATIMSNRQCVIDSNAFNSAPYDLPWGSSIFARVSATNVKGTSQVSLSGNGG